MRHAFSPLQIEDYFFEQRASEFLAITVGDSRRGPDLLQIGTEHLYALELLGAKCVGTVLFAAAQLRFGRGEIVQAILPFVLQAASNQPIFAPPRSGNGARPFRPHSARVPPPTAIATKQRHGWLGVVGRRAWLLPRQPA